MLVPRISALLADLDAARAAMSSAEISRWMRSRVRDEFLAAIAQQADALKRLRSDVESKVVRDVYWNTFESRRRECTTLLRECLAFVQGASLRALALDSGVCEIADALVEELSSRSQAWGRFTLLADADSYADLTGIIHIRFPASDVWNLPIIAHEFGHYLARYLVARDFANEHALVFRDLVEEQGKTAEALEQSWTRSDDRRFEEHFADAAAAYAVGPAYACACLLLHFSPVNATKEFSEHPADADRCYVVLKVLQLLQETPGSKGMAGIISYLERQWQEALGQAGCTVNAERRSELERIARVFFRRLESGAPKLKFTSWPAVYELATRIKPPNNPTVSADMRLVDVLNAAWAARADVPQEPATYNEINRRAMAIAKTIARQRASTTMGSGR